MKFTLKPTVKKLSSSWEVAIFLRLLQVDLELFCTKLARYDETVGQEFPFLSITPLEVTPEKHLFTNAWIQAILKTRSLFLVSNSTTVLLLHFKYVDKIPNKICIFHTIFEVKKWEFEMRHYEQRQGKKTVFILSTTDFTILRTPFLFRFQDSTIMKLVFIISSYNKKFCQFASHNYVLCVLTGQKWNKFGNSQYHMALQWLQLTFSISRKVFIDVY